MIVRGANARVVDYGPAPARVDGLEAINVLALRGDYQETPIERRTATADELARLELPEPPKPEPVAAVSRRGRVNEWSLLHPDTRLWDALRETDGNVSGAARILGQSRYAVADRVARRRAAGLIPGDVRVLLDTYRTHKVGRKLHDPATRALISLRLREFHARKRAA